MDLATLHSSQRPIVVTSLKTSDACGVITIAVECNTEKKQIRTLFAVLRRCLFLQRLFLAHICQNLTVTAYNFSFYSKHHKLKSLCERETQ